MIFSYGASLTGTSHISRDIGNQDAYTVKRGSDGYFVAAVADGLGSEKYSDRGAAEAVNTSVAFCAEHIHEGLSDDAIIGIIRNSFAEAYEAVLKRADTDGESRNEFDTTLCLAVYCPDGHLLYGNAGDSGLVVLLADGHYTRCTSRMTDEFGGVYALCFEDKWEFGSIEQPVSSLLLATDGMLNKICYPGLDDIVPVYIPLARMFLNPDCTRDEWPKLEEAANKYLEQFPGVEDDKTILVLINSEIEPAILNDSYYAEPELSELTKKREDILSAINVDTKEASTTVMEEDPKEKKTRKPGKKKTEVRCATDKTLVRARICAYITLALMAISGFVYYLIRIILLLS